MCKIFDIRGLTERQSNIYEWINDTHQLPVYAEIYKLAVTLINQKPPGYVTFVAHAGREIVNGLASEISGRVRKQVQYAQCLDKISGKWEDQWGASMLDSEPPDHHEIPYDICVDIRALIDEHKGKAKAEDYDLLSLSIFLGYNDMSLIPPNFTKEWKAARMGFLEYTHIRKNKISDDDAAELVGHFRVLETYLSISATSQYGRIGELDEILEQTNK